MQQLRNIVAVGRGEVFTGNFDEVRTELIFVLVDVSQLLHTIGDFERIGDHAVNLLRVAREIHDKDLKFSEKAQQELEVFTGAIIEILNITTDAFVENNLQLSYEVEPLEQVIDSLKVELKNRRWYATAAKHRCCRPWRGFYWKF